MIDRVNAASPGTLRHIPASLDPVVVADIDARLEAIEGEHNVSILLAIESGSRAWGFPSPDSDYDCRFVYVRPREDYLALFPKRDVIETPMTAVLDVNGWDLGKALRLMLNGNAVIIEWLTSPIVYRANATFRAEFLALASDTADRVRIARHYLHLAESIIARHLRDPGDVALKKIFYALRPAIALRWLRHHPEARVAPMNFQELCAGAGLAQPLSQEIAALLAEKAQTRELGRGALPAAIRETISRELAEAAAEFEKRPPYPVAHVAAADAFFRRWLEPAGRPKI